MVVAHRVVSSATASRGVSVEKAVFCTRIHSLPRARTANAPRLTEQPVPETEHQKSLRVLGISSTCDFVDKNMVIAMHRSRSIVLHPDKAGDTPSAHEAMVQLNNAKDYLLAYMR